MVSFKHQCSCRYSDYDDDDDDDCVSAVRPRFVWWTFTSATKKLSVTKDFLGTGPRMHSSSTTDADVQAWVLSVNGSQVKEVNLNVRKAVQWLYMRL